jgi:sugar-specific transcriptional regulator TrmB
MPQNKLKPVWQNLDDLEALEDKIVEMISRSTSEVCIMTETFHWYIKAKKELLTALDRKVAVKVILLKYDGDTEQRVRDMNTYGMQVKLADSKWRRTRYSIVDGIELAFLIWDKKGEGGDEYFKPGYTKRLGLVSVFVDSFEHVWGTAKRI